MILTYGLIAFAGWCGWCGWCGWKRFKRWKDAPPDSHTLLCIQFFDWKNINPLVEFSISVPNEEVEETLYQIQTLSYNPIFVQHCESVHWVTVRTADFTLIELRIRH